MNIFSIEQFSPQAMIFYQEAQEHKKRAAVTERQLSQTRQHQYKEFCVLQQGPFHSYSLNILIRCDLCIIKWVSFKWINGFSPNTCIFCLFVCFCTASTNHHSGYKLFSTDPHFKMKIKAQLAIIKRDYENKYLLTLRIWKHTFFA